MEVFIIFASNNCFSERNISQNGVDALSKIDDAGLTKSWTFRLVRIIRLCSNYASLWHKHLLWNYKLNFRLPISEFATVTRKLIPYWNINFLHGPFNVPKFFHVSIAVANRIRTKSDELHRIWKKKKKKPCTLC